MQVILARGGLELSQAKAMMPLFEAISNAFDAIEEHRDGFSGYSIRIRLVATHDLAQTSASP